MNRKICDYCGNEYDGNLNNCPFCTVKTNDDLVDISSFNGIREKNESSDSIIVNKSIITNESIIMEPSKEEDEIDLKLQKKIDIIDKRNLSVKNANKRKNKTNDSKFFSYLLLVIGMTLLFIITFSSFLNFSFIPLIHYSFTILCLFIAFNFTHNDKEVGYFLSTIAAISMIIMIYEEDYISAIIGVYIFASSFRFLIKK